MRRLVLGFLLLCGGSGILSAQSLNCPPVSTASGKPCETFHYHVAMYRPDTRGMSELYGINQFATQAACDRARDLAAKRNNAIVEHMRPFDANYKGDVFGACHCDMTIERNSPNFLTDAARVNQIKLAEEIRLRVKERLLDTNVTPDSELIRGLAVAALAPPPLMGGARVVPLPPPAPVVAVSNSPDDLRMTKAVDTSAPQTAAVDLPLVDIPIAEAAPAVAAPMPATTVAQAPAPAPAPAPTAPLPSVTVPAPPEPAPATAEPAPATTATTTTTPATAAGSDGGGTPAPAPAPAPATIPAPQPLETAAVAEPTMSAEDAADAFISVEADRINNVLAAAGAISDANLSEAVLRACSERSAVLGNLRTLIIGAGARSRLANAAAKAHDEADRIAFVARLFGKDMPPHWAPKDAKDVVLDLPADFDPEKILRDTNASAETKKKALYVLLARTQPAEDQQMWLTSMIDGFLQ